MELFPTPGLTMLKADSNSSDTYLPIREILLSNSSEPIALISWLYRNNQGHSPCVPGIWGSASEAILILPGHFVLWLLLAWVL